MINVDEFAKELRANAGKISKRQCATYLRIALAAGGARTYAHPAEARNYGPLLARNGYSVIQVEEPERFVPKKGDIVVFQPTRTGNKAGHIQGFDGRNWVSDFVQTGFWPGPGYRRERPSYVVYRP
jgi:type VI secretion system secreted protein VgrG